ncbi:hypothetical protein Bca52824_063580 [Brassica carinata]|uniref:Uncharacterized protein n=1 Tax=Brassica carinata TaxID=52824 RepID=A0A8X7U7E2_BRACI|nr:hypothetical protein Bca52824_063580 [Brassica carinata]
MEVAAPPLGPLPAPRLWLATESAAGVRENDQLSIYGDTKTAQTVMLTQHQLCKILPDIKMLFTNHTYAVSNGPLAPSSVNQPVTTLTKPTAFPSLGAHGINLNPFRPGTVAAANAAKWPWS